MGVNQPTNLPVSLKNCPIVDAVVEIRFTTEIVAPAVFGMAYTVLKKDYPKYQKLPILELPEQIRAMDSNFKGKPHYKLMEAGSGKSFIQIGPDVISISPTMPYAGWKIFSNAAFEVMEKLIKAGLILGVERIGIRYTNFFEGMDIFKKVNLSVTYNNNPIDFKNTILRTEIEDSGFLNTLQVTNNASRRKENRLASKGSLIDVDTFKMYKNEILSISNLTQEINDGHNIEKKIFWNLLGEELKSELQPTY